AADVEDARAGLDRALEGAPERAVARGVGDEPAVLRQEIVEPAQGKGPRHRSRILAASGAGSERTVRSPARWAPRKLWSTSVWVWRRAAPRHEPLPKGPDREPRGDRGARGPHLPRAGHPDRCRVLRRRRGRVPRPRGRRGRPHRSRGGPPLLPRPGRAP